MAWGRYPTWDRNGDGFSANGGPTRRKRSPARVLAIATGVVLIAAALLAAAGAISAQSPSGDGPAEEQAPPPVGSPAPTATPTVAPDATPQREYAGAAAGAGEPEPEVHLTATVDDAGTTSSTVQAPRTVASSWSAGPIPAPPAPAPAPATSVAALAADAEIAYGVRILLDGQDWGADEVSQEANVRAVISAVDRLPDTVLSAVVAHPHGPLTFVSNGQGRTLDGWQPYGGRPMAFYTNSDQGADGYHASNQVVLTVGATSMSVGHEALHAYQFRNVGPHDYVLALLQEEMRSFMAATGWRQTGSDDEVRQAARQPWSALEALYAYEGRPLTYATTGGTSSAITPTNPIEAFAIAGSIYYTRPSWMPLPEWPEYWDWFKANVG